MDTNGDRKFIEISGEEVHELPPLLVRAMIRKPYGIIEMAERVIETENIIPDTERDGFVLSSGAESRKMELAINLADQYRKLLRQWQWGDAVLRWIRQCEMTFSMRMELRPLLRPDIWPHAGRCSFVTLLAGKAFAAEDVDWEKAVGLRLNFRQPPPISCFTDQFLFYLNPQVASGAYNTWAQMASQPTCLLPPGRFTFDIIDIG